MAAACPLLAQARMEVLNPVERVRAAVTARAAFGDAVGAELALALVAGVPVARLSAVLSEVSLLDPGLVEALAAAAGAAGASGLDDMGTAADRRRVVDDALGRLGHKPLVAVALTAQPEG
jgi:hypothetical protein